MLTVDQIRREMEKIGELPGRHKTPGDRKEPDEMRGKTKVARTIPDTVDRRWIYMARKSELKKILAERYGMAEDLLDGGVKSLRKIAGEQIGGKRRIRAAASARPKRAKVQRAPKVVGTDKPRLVLAETFPCPSCGAQLMIERGGEG
jgi:hypothetical protein